MTYTNVIPAPSYKIRLNGCALQVIRESLGIRKSDLAARSDISAGYLTRLEQGARQPSPDNLRKIASGLRVPVEAISYPEASHAAVPNG